MIVWRLPVYESNRSPVLDRRPIEPPCRASSDQAEGHRFMRAAGASAFDIMANVQGS